MTPTPRQRRLSFSLRTLFALITLACLAAGWVACQFNWIKQRHAALRNLDHNFVGSYTKAYPPTDAPGMLWVFGEDGTGVIVVYWDHENLPDTQRLQLLFPEATLAYGSL